MRKMRHPNYIGRRVVKQRHDMYYNLVCLLVEYRYMKVRNGSAKSAKVETGQELRKLQMGLLEILVERSCFILWNTYKIAV